MRLRRSLWKEGLGRRSALGWAPPADFGAEASDESDHREREFEFVEAQEVGSPDEMPAESEEGASLYQVAASQRADEGSAELRQLKRVSTRRGVSAAAVAGAVTVTSFSGPASSARVQVKQHGATVAYTAGVARDSMVKQSSITEAESAMFYQLAEQWREESAFVSSTTRIISHPAYLQIIAMGEVVVPLILKELQKEPGHWFHALHVITGASPESRRDAGDMKRLADAWIDWGIKHHYLKP